jgi:hypothetical protein
MAQCELCQDKLGDGWCSKCTAEADKASRKREAARKRLQEVYGKVKEGGE